jgi:hypothetical protein
MSSVRSWLLPLVLSHLLLPSLAVAQQPPAPPWPSPTARTLRVEGTGEVKVSPDEAFIDVAVETVGKTAKGAGEENARKMEAVMGALVKGGLARKDIETRHFAVFPEHTPVERPGQAPQLRGYRVSNTVSAHVRDLRQVGPLLDAALAAGANRVDGVRFGLSRPQEAQGRALEDAVGRARQSAQVLATALGVKLGPVLDASTVSEPPRFIPLQRFEAAQGALADVASTPIQPEEQNVQARVTLIYAIEERGSEPPPAGAPGTPRR